METNIRPFVVPALAISKKENVIVGYFQAMGSPCEIHIETDDTLVAQALLDRGANEAWRIQKKFSRYQTGNIVHQINTSQGRPVTVDEETARLLDFATNCFQMSDGLFDITSGVLRHPHATTEHVGWEKVSWRSPIIQLQPGMEIDLGGIAKEYAVDRVIDMLRQQTAGSVLVNFGGDIATSGKKQDGSAWSVGIEDPRKSNKAIRILNMTSGAVATSGNTKRPGHIFNPRTGQPVQGAPQSVTVVASTCTEAGFLSTYGMLKGHDADTALTRIGVPHWCN